MLGSCPLDGSAWHWVAGGGPAAAEAAGEQRKLPLQLLLAPDGISAGWLMCGWLSRGAVPSLAQHAGCTGRSTACSDTGPSKRCSVLIGWGHRSSAAPEPPDPHPTDASLIVADRGGHRPARAAPQSAAARRGEAAGGDAVRPASDGAWHSCTTAPHRPGAGRRRSASCNLSLHETALNHRRRQEPGSPGRSRASRSGLAGQGLRSRATDT